MTRTQPRPRKSRGILAIIGPGMLIAATGVGAGDLATAGFAGSRLGLAIGWAVLLGAILKFILTEGLTRWQLATGSTILEGAIHHYGWALRLGFLIYFLPWSYFTGAAMMSACGVTMQSIVRIEGDPVLFTLAWGAMHSAIGFTVAWHGGFRLFERIMSVTIGIMFFSVIATAIMLKPDWIDVLTGLAIPRIPAFHDGGLTWTIALMGGVGGTLTILCYGYWIREEGRTEPSELRTCRLDLASGYIMTALFGVAMIIIASGIEFGGRGTELIVNLADRLGETSGPAGRWIFLVGAWAAVFSSLLGVWQAVPYVFADFWRMTKPTGAETAGIAQRRVDTRSTSYRLFLMALATVPLIQVRFPFEQVQLYYTVTGAAFIPLLALMLLLMNGKREWVGEHRNRPATTVLLIATLVFFIVAGVLQIRGG